MATALKQHTRLIYEAVTASHLPFLPVALHHRPSRGKGLPSEKSPTFQLIGRPCHSFSGQLLSPHGLFASQNANECAGISSTKLPGVTFGLQIVTEVID